MASLRVDARPKRPLHALLQNGFRPFFLGAALWVPIALALWLAMLRGVLWLPSAFDPLTWHGHEMLFGYAAAVIAGFALTAVPNWTGRLPLRGGPLALLFGLWLAGRVAVAISLVIGPVAALLVDVGFLLTMTALVLREIISGRNWRNLPIAVLLGLLAASNLLMHLGPTAGLDTEALGQRLGIATVLVLIGLVGGRVVPSFSRNWLAKRPGEALPAPHGRFDLLALLVMIAALLAWTLWPQAGATGDLLLLAGLLHTLRLGRWRGWRTGAEPLVLILHLGYAWLPLGFGLVGLEILAPGLPLAARHALTAGAVGTMTLAIMTRASLGHTGHALHAGPATVLIYAGVVGGALLRVATPALAIDPIVSLSVAALLWGGAFVLFVLMYGPMLLGLRFRQPRAA
jgi:uncharacterized protein involved in response to NO